MLSAAQYWCWLIGYVPFSSPTLLDLSLTAVLSLVLELDLPQPLLADVIRGEFPRLVTHYSQSVCFNGLTDLPAIHLQASSRWGAIAGLIPTLPDLSKTLGFGLRPRRALPKKKSKGQQEFETKRLYFGAVVATGLLVWRVATTAGPGIEDGDDWETA